MPLTVKVSGRGFDQFVKTLTELKRPINKDTAEEIGKSAVDEMKDLISKGISPIAGKGRFPQYKNPKKYPGKKKPRTPVNLVGVGPTKGDFQDALTFRTKPSPAGHATEIFYQGTLEDLKESGHRDGVHGQPKRPTIPQGSETFAERIVRNFSKIFRERIRKIIG